ncbi:MAG: BrnT family toxin [Rhodanobacteraceae bacterium]
MYDVRYEWDEAKRQANLAKHGVDFIDAVGALEDPGNWTVEDRAAVGEARYVTLGRGFSDRVLYVVWIERTPNVLRIISARKASPGEARQYPR